MFATFKSFTAALALFTVGLQASPLSRRDVISPKITSPNADSVWPVGSSQTVTWDTSDFPPVSQITNILGKVVLGFDANDSLNLDLDHPLAQNFNITDGSVKITVPNVQPRDDYLIVLFGDSGNTSPSFSITRITSPSNTTTTTTSGTKAATTTTRSGSSSTTPVSGTTTVTNPPTPPFTGSTITGGESGTTTDIATTTGDSVTETATDATTTATDSTTAPETTATSPTSSITGSVTTQALPASASNTSAGWSIHHSGSMNLKTMTLCLGAVLSALALL